MPRGANSAEFYRAAPVGWAVPANVICSTSVGSVNAIQLAHGGTAVAQRAAFDRLKTIWETQLTFNEDMYVEAAWLQGVTPRTRNAIESVFGGRIDIPSLFSQVVFFPPYAIGQAVALGSDLYDALDGLSSASSVFTLTPTRNLIATNLNPAAVGNSGVELRLVAVSLDSGAIRYITQNGSVLETDGTPVVGANPTVCVGERAAYNRALAARNDASRALGQAARADRGESRRELREATAALGTADERLNQCMAGALAAGTGNRLVVNLIDAVIASSSIPCVFPPVTLGDEAYVDGGIRWVLPLQAALDFDTEFVIAINACQPACHRRA